jgi:hypothetical protein
MLNMLNTFEATARRPSIHRRSIIVDRPLQYRMIRTVLAAWVAHSVLFSMVLYFFYQGHLLRFYEFVPRAGLSPMISPGALFVVSLGFVLVFGLLVIFLVALFMSSQIAGPLYRLKLAMVRAGRGDWGFHLQFRQRDFLGDVPMAFNNMLDNLRHHAEIDLEELRALEMLDDEPAEWRRLLRRQIARKEAQLGVAPEPGFPVREFEAISVTVH